MRRLSLYLKTRRAEYYRLLQEVRERGAWEAWLEFFLDGVAETANQAFDAATRISSSKTANGLPPRASAPTRRSAYTTLMQQNPYVTSNQLVERTGLSSPTVNAALADLVRLGIGSHRPPARSRVRLSAVSGHSGRGDGTRWSSLIVGPLNFRVALWLPIARLFGPERPRRMARPTRVWLTAQRIVSRLDRFAVSVRPALFISHASPEDNRFVLWLGAKLAALGYEVWADVLRLRGGDDWQRKLEDALRARAAKVLFVANPVSAAKQGVRNEIQIATEVAKKVRDNEFIIPLRLAPYEAPFLIAHAQYIDFSETV